jgi:hypothetical protein
MIGNHERPDSPRARRRSERMDTSLSKMHSLLVEGFRESRPAFGTKFVVGSRLRESNEEHRDQDNISTDEGEFDCGTSQ